MEITIWGVLVGAVLPLAGYIVVHRLAMHRDVVSRKALAGNDFRRKVIEALSRLPEASRHWLEQDLINLPVIYKEIETASEIFRYFLAEKDREQFSATLTLLKNQMIVHVPQAHETANVFYPSNERTPDQAKEELMTRIEELKSYAEKT